MHRPSTSTIIASTALFFSLVGTGLAAKGTHPTPIHYVITTTKQIKPSVLSSLHGSQGPRGLAGPAGPAGAAGAAGAAGPAGHFTGTESLITGAGTAPGATVGAQATSVATCPAGTNVIGGGYSWGLGTIPANVTVVADSPQGTGGWAVTIQNNAAAAIASQFVAQALCAS